MPFSLSPADQLLVQQPVLLGDQSVGSLGDSRQLNRGRQPIGGKVLRLEPGIQLLLQPGYPDLEEFVEVGADDGKELHPLEPGVGRVSRLLQHARVELEPAQLAVQVVLRRETAPGFSAEARGLAGRDYVQPAGSVGTLSRRPRFWG